MKKILVAACLLGMMGVSANGDFYPDDFYPDEDIQFYLTIEKGLYHQKRACDEPQSQACKLETEKVCQEEKECLESYAQLNNTERDKFDAERSIGYFLLSSLQEEYNKKNFKRFLETAKSLGWSKEEVLNIKNKKLKSQLQDIEQVFSSKKACDEPQSQACQVKKEELSQAIKQYLEVLRLTELHKEDFEAKKETKCFLNHPQHAKYNRENYIKCLEYVFYTEAVKKLGVDWAKKEREKRMFQL